MTATALAEAAEEFVGSPFRLHGRDPRTGLDCIGVLAAALAAIGRKAPLPDNYALRTRAVDGLDRHARNCGFAPTQLAIEPGDILFARVSPCQFHLLIAARNGKFVHAHARLKRVVLSAGPLDWPILARWRLIEPH